MDALKRLERISRFNKIMKIVLLGGTGGCLDLVDLIQDIQDSGVDIEIHGVLEDREIDNLLRNKNVEYLGKFSEKIIILQLQLEIQRITK